MNSGTWTIHRLQGSLGLHAAAWDELRQRLLGANPMIGSAFINALLQHFGKGNERLCLLHRDGQVQAMCVVQPGGPLVWKSFLPAQAQIGPTLLTDPAAVRSLIRALPGPAGELDLLCCDPAFGDLPERSFTQGHSIDHTLTMHIELQGSFADYWAARTKKLTQNMDRYRRRAEADGMCQRFVFITDAAALPGAVARYAELEASGWKGNCGTAVGSNIDQQDFYTQLMQTHARQGLAVAWELWFDDRLVASRLAIGEDKTLVMLKTTYRESDAAYAPGRELMRRAIEHSFDLIPGGRIEFYTDATDDQLKWATGHRWIRHLAFYSHPTVRMAAMAARLGRRLTSRRGRALAEGLTVSVYRHPDEFPPALLHLFSEAEHNSMQFGVDWYRNLIDNVFREHTGVKFYVLALQDKPVAALPLLATRTRLGWRIQALSNYYTALYAPLLSPGVRDSELAELFKAIDKDHPGLNSIQLMPMDTGDRSFRTLQSALNAANFACFPYYCFGNWFMPVRETWASYLQGRNGRQRSTITRMGKKLLAEGGRLELIPNDDIERGLRAYEAVYAASWKQPEPYKGFMPGLIRLCANRGWLRLGVAWLGDKPIAAQFWIIANGRADIYKLAYDEAYKGYSPGTLLTAMLMQQAMDVDKVKEIDYLIGDDPYKQSWMCSRRERWGLIAYNLFSPLGFAGLLRELGGRMTKHLLKRLKRGTLRSAAASE